MLKEYNFRRTWNPYETGLNTTYSDLKLLRKKVDRFWQRLKTLIPFTCPIILTDLNKCIVVKLYSVFKILYISVKAFKMKSTVL